MSEYLQHVDFNTAQAQPEKPAIVEPVSEEDSYWQSIADGTMPDTIYFPIVADGEPAQGENVPVQTAAELPDQDRQKIKLTYSNDPLAGCEGTPCYLQFQAVSHEIMRRVEYMNYYIIDQTGDVITYREEINISPGPCWSFEDECKGSAVLNPVYLDEALGSPDGKVMPVCGDNTECTAIVPFLGCGEIESIPGGGIAAVPAGKKACNGFLTWLMGR